MAGHLTNPVILQRRQLVKSMTAALALGAVGGFPSRGVTAGSAWADRPGSKVDKLNFVVWTYGDIYTKIAKKFTDDWGIVVDSTISSFNDHPAKLMTMYAGGETIDVSQSSPFSFPNFISQGLVEPLDDLPGAKDYLADFTESAKQVAVYDGKLMGLPYFSTVWVWNYYSDMLEKARFEPFKTYDELMEQLRKAKTDKISEYPIQWVAGVGLEQLPGTWYQMTWNRGGRFFDAGGNHQLGPGSIARETLKWWVQTFTEQLADPRIPEGSVHDLGQGVLGRQEHLPRSEPSLRPQHRQRSCPVADRRQGQGSRLARRRPYDWRHPRLFRVRGQS